MITNPSRLETYICVPLWHHITNIRSNVTKKTSRMEFFFFTSMELITRPETPLQQHNVKREFWNMQKHIVLFEEKKKQKKVSLQYWADCKHWYPGPPGSPRLPCIKGPSCVLTRPKLQFGLRAWSGTHWAVSALRTSNDPFPMGSVWSGLRVCFGWAYFWSAERRGGKGDKGSFQTWCQWP